MTKYRKYSKKEIELYKKLFKEHKEFNRYVLTGRAAEELVKAFNDSIEMAGEFTVEQMRLYVSDLDCGEADWKYGWTTKISFKRDFKVATRDGVICCQLNLPPYKELD